MARRHLIFLLVAGGAVLLANAQAQEQTPGEQPSANAAIPASPPAAARSESEASSRSPASPTPNPLEAFLNVWMTPRDHAILRRSSPTSGPAAPADEIWRNIAGAAPASAPPQPASTNPYVKAMAVAARPPTDATPAPIVTVSGPTTKTGADPSAPGMIESEPPLAAPPTQYRPPPPSDAKYFPQLKRF